MMGCKARVFLPVPAVSLEERVPADHFYRHLDRVLDLAFVRELVRDCYAVAGRPSVDPVVFFKLQLVLFFAGVRSERLLMRTVADRLSVRWYVGYNLDDPLPDQCQQAGLVWGRERSFAATHVLADASLDWLAPRFAVDAREALQAHLAALVPDETIQDAHGEAPDAAAGVAPHAAAKGVAAIQDQDSAGPSAPLPPRPLRVDLPDPVREELAAATARRHDGIAQHGRQPRAVHGVYQRTADLLCAAARLTRMPRRCASKAAAPTWATKRTTSSLAANDGSSWGSWSLLAR